MSIHSAIIESNVGTQKKDQSSDFAFPSGCISKWIEIVYITAALLQIAKKPTEMSRAEG